MYSKIIRAAHAWWPTMHSRRRTRFAGVLNALVLPRDQLDNHGVDAWVRHAGGSNGFCDTGFDRV